MRFALCLLTSASLVLCGCETIGSLVGVGVGAAVKKDQESEVSESFTAPMPRTKAAVLAALKRMQIEITSSEGERIAGKTKEHPVEIKLNAVTDKTTKMTVKIGEGLKKDRATAEEVVEQTRRALGARATS